MDMTEFLARLQDALGTNLAGLASKSGLTLGHLSGLAGGHKPLAKPTYLKLRAISPEPLQHSLDLVFEGGHEQSPVMRHIRDVHAYSLRMQEQPFPVRLTGLIRSVAKKTQRYMFWTVFDDTGIIDCYLAADALGDELFAKLKELKQGERIFIEGTTGVNQSGDLLITAANAGVLSTAFEFDSYVGAHVRLSTNLTAALYLPRLENHFRHRMANEGYVELATRLTVTEWPKGGVEPLQIFYNGFGGNFSISPTPVSQLIDSIVNSQMEHVFAVAPCFTQTYRDPHVSTEFRVLSAAAIRVELEDLLQSCYRMILDLYSSGQTAPLSSAPSSGKAKVKRSVYPPATDSGVVLAPQIQLFTTSSSSPGAGRIVGRLCWPVVGRTHPDFAEYVLAEGHSELGRGNEVITAFTINLERLLSMLLSECDIRRIPSLAIGDDGVN